MAKLGRFAFIITNIENNMTNFAGIDLFSEQLYKHFM
jgi:hypothetical protein